MFRVLRHGGRYLVYTAENTDPLEYHTSPRAQLAGRVAASLFGQTYMEDATHVLVMNPTEIGFEGTSFELKNSRQSELVVAWRKP